MAFIDDINRIKENEKAEKDREERLARQLESSDAVQRAVLESAKATVRTQNEIADELAEKIEKMPKGLATSKDIRELTNATAALIGEMKGLRKEAAEKQIDFSDLVAGLDVLGTKSDMTSESQQLVLDNLANEINSLRNDLNTQSKELENALSSIDFSPEFNPTIDVAPTPVSVEAPEVTVDTKDMAEAVRGLESRLESIENNLPSFPWEMMQMWFERMNENLEWIANRPQVVGSGGALGTGTATPSEDISGGLDNLLLTNGTDNLLLASGSEDVLLLQ